jgi:hypothetical protein
VQRWEQQCASERIQKEGRDSREERPMNLAWIRKNMSLYKIKLKNVCVSKL